MKTLHEEKLKKDAVDYKKLITKAKADAKKAEVDADAAAKLKEEFDTKLKVLKEACKKVL
jgi:hypothetical protein